MRTRDFVRLIEAAYERVYGEQGEMRSVPYDPKPGDETVPVTECLGILLTKDQHMALITAEAMYIIWDESEMQYSADEDKDEALGDLRDIISGMRVAPYMQWTCIYFPGLTAEQVETGEF